MNENADLPTTPKPVPPSALAGPQATASTRPLAYWLKRFLACNPFYLVSAALLLYGLYRISVDPSFLTREIAQLCFNLTSLQFYEALLVVTAIFLARRAIWYDSTLLVGLENMLVLVPFILISQAALIDPRVVWTVSLAAGLLVVARFGGLKRAIAALNFPRRLAGMGLVVLTVNVALPVVYRLLHESKFGTRPDWGAAYHVNQYAWWALLPVTCALVNFLQPARRAGELLPRHRLLPLGFFSLWLAGTGVHLYCLSYIYDFSLRPELLAPAVWMVLWMLHQRAPDLLPALKPAWRRALWIPPLLATFLAVSQPGKGVFLALTALNAGIYGGLYLSQRGQRLALNLFLISLLALISGLPEEWTGTIAGEYGRAKCVGAGGVIYFLLWAALSREPKRGIFGALVCAGAIIGLGGGQADTFHWAAQGGLVFLLMHSLRWADADQEGASVVRGLTCLFWVAHSFLWMHLGGESWMTCTVAGPVLVACLLVRWLSGRWGPKIVPVAAILVLLSGPGDFTAGRVQTAPAGLLAIIGSFLLFGLGTLAALTKHVWNKTGTR